MLKTLNIVQIGTNIKVGQSTKKLEKIGAVLLCGGRSRRMGYDKWRLPVGSNTMLDHLLKKLKNVCAPIVVSVSNNDVKFEAANDIFQVRDQFESSGPLEGIRASLEFLFLTSDCEFAFVTACDVPYVNIKVIELLRERIGGAEAIVPVQNNRRFGMTSLIRTSAHQKIKQLVLAKRLKVSYLVDILDCVEFPAHEIRAVDEELLCLTNVNTPNQYLEFLRREGWQCDSHTYRRLFDSRSESSESTS